MDAKAVSKPVGDIATSLYAREEDHAARTATGLVLRSKRSRQDGNDRSTDSSSDSSRDSSSDYSDDEGSAEEYLARLPSRATFTRVIDLVSADPDSFYLVHCGAHQLNLINGKSFASIEEEGLE
jgi:hypothetical protein